MVQFSNVSRVMESEVIAKNRTKVEKGQPCPDMVAPAPIAKTVIDIASSGVENVELTFRTI